MGRNLPGQQPFNPTPLICTNDYKNIAPVRFLLELRISSCASTYIFFQIPEEPRRIFFSVLYLGHLAVGCWVSACTLCTFCSIGVLDPTADRSFQDTTTWDCILCLLGSVPPFFGELSCTCHSESYCPSWLTSAWLRYHCCST